MCTAFPNIMISNDVRPYSHFRRRHRAEAKANSTKEIVLQLHEDVENKEQKKRKY